MGEPRRCLTYGIILAWLALLAAIALPNFNQKPKKGRSKNNCINNLRLIDSAKQQWALENNKTNSDTPTWADIQLYMARGGSYIPKCPLGGVYILGPMSNKPTCSYPGHALL